MRSILIIIRYDNNVCRQIKHPNIVHMHGCAATDQEMVIVMGYVNGANQHSKLFGKTEKSAMQ